MFCVHRKQIVLNETCDTLREVQQQTAEIDIGLENLAEDLENDKQEAAAVKSDLLNDKVRNSIISYVPVL